MRSAVYFYNIIIELSIRTTHSGSGNLSSDDFSSEVTSMGRRHTKYQRRQARRRV